MRLILAVYLALAAGVVQQAPQQPPRAAVSGIVTDGTTGQPIAGAVVELRRTPGVSSAILSSNRVTTDSKGRFVLMGVEPAEGYTMVARAAGYIDATYGWKPGMSDFIRDQLRFKLAEGEWKQDAGVALFRQPSISGRVVDESGNPVVGTAVRAFAVATISGLPRLLASGSVATTDDRGIYRLDHLEPGRYKVAAISVQQTVPASVREVAQTRPIGTLGVTSYGGGPDYETSGPALGTDGTHRLVVTSFVTPPAPLNGRPRAYPTVFYPGVQAIDDASIVVVSYGEDQRDIDLRLQPVPAFTVSGRFDRPLEQPLLLRLMPLGHEDLAAGSEVATTASDKDGSYTFLNVPAGLYTLMAQAPLSDMMWGFAIGARVLDPPGFPNGVTGGGSYPGMQNVSVLTRYGKPATAFGRIPLTVSGDMKNHILPLLPTTTVRGRVVFDPSVQLPAPSLSIRAEPTDGDPALGNADGRVTPAGTFEITGLLGGRYSLLTLSSMLVESIMWRGRDITETGIDTRQEQAADIGDVVVTMTNRGIVVKGAVRGIPANTRATVIAFPPARESWANYGWNPRRIKAAMTDATGAYELPKLPAGDYLIVAVDAVKTNAWTDQRFLAAAAPAAQRITLTWGETKSIALSFSNVVVK